MKNFTWLLGLLVFAAPAAADEILLKDGKRIVWTAIRDMGDSYEVDTAAGKVTVRKPDVDRIVTIGNTEPLTGASFTFEKKKKLATTNLLAAVDIKKQAFQGAWAMKGTELSGSSGVEANSRFFFQGSAPDEYDLTLEIARKNGEGDFDIGLVAGGKQCVLALDAANCTVSGFSMEGKTLDASNGILGRFFTNGTARQVVCMVRKAGIVVQVDGKDFIACPASDFPKLFVHPAHAVPPRDAFFLVCWKGTFAVTKAVLSAPKAQP